MHDRILSADGSGAAMQRGVQLPIAALFLLLALALLGALAPAASAARGVVSVFGVTGSGGGGFSNAAGVGVNNASGDVYVVDQSANRVEEFDATGVFVRVFGWGVQDGEAKAETCTSECRAGLAGAGEGQFENPTGVAVDQTDGSVYVTDTNNGRVEKFTGEGEYLSSFGSPGSEEGQLSFPQGVSVDPTDRSVYVADTGNQRVQKFDSKGKFVSMFGSEGSEEGQFLAPTSIAVDSTGRAYVLDSGNGRVERFTAAGAFDEVFDPTDVFAPVQLAVGPANDDVFVAQYAPDFSEQHVIEVEPNGTRIETDGEGSTANQAQGLAVSATGERVYLADGFNARVLILAPLTPPQATIEPASNVTSTTADLAGAVTPNGAPTVSWHFEVSTDGVNYSALAADREAGTGNEPIPVNESLTGLVPNTTYHIRLAATRPLNAAVHSAPVEFQTPAIPPTATTEPAQDLAPEHAALEGIVEPNHDATSYLFEYGTTTAYGKTLPAGGEESAGEVNQNVGAVLRLQGLAPGTTYHYRLVAKNSGGTTQGADQTFTTTTPPPASAERPGIPGSGFLPDNRGWEMVSPADKNGADVMADSARSHAAADGNAASFASLGGFGDVQGGGVSIEYLAQRTGQAGTSGWITHAITPKQEPLTFPGAAFSADVEYQGLSADLSHGVFRAWSPLTEEPNVANVVNLDVRSDLLSPGSGSYQLLSGCASCSSPFPPLQNHAEVPRLAGSSADFSHVIFESILQLTPEAPAVGKSVYEWDHGTLRVASILPDGSAAANATAGDGVSASGGEIAFHVISADGRRVFFTDTSTRDLYMRENDATTVELNASERTDCADHDPCTGAPEPDPAGSEPAKYWDASLNGSRVFFTTQEKLTNDDTNAVNDLYMYDAEAPAGHHLTRLSVDHEPGQANRGVQGVIGAGGEGHYVYFLDLSQLVADQPSIRSPGFYMWHDGTVSYVGEAEDLGNVPGLINGGSDLARVTPDGRNLLFTARVPHPDSRDSLVGYNGGACHGTAGGCAELYLYNAESHHLRCVSCDPSGAAPVSDALVNVREHTGGAGTTAYLNRAISDDGRRVFFSTADALVPGDVNGAYDVYEYDVPTATLHLLSGGTDPADSYFMDASPSGDDAFLLTDQRLGGWDVDQGYDLYDARVGGGLPEPPPAASPCQPEACRGAAAAGSPAFETPSSVQLDSHGNRAAPPSAPPPSHAGPTKLQRALRACRAIHNKPRRKRCEAAARRRYRRSH